MAVTSVERWSGRQLGVSCKSHLDWRASLVTSVRRCAERHQCRDGCSDYSIYIAGGVGQRMDLLGTSISPVNGQASSGFLAKLIP